MALRDYLFRARDLLARLLGRREEPEEEDEEPEVPPEAEESEEGALIGGEMTTGAPVPTYKKTEIPSTRGPTLRYVSETEDIRTMKEYVTVIKPNLILRNHTDDFYEFITMPVEEDGIFTGDPAAYLPYKELFSMPGFYVDGDILLSVHLKTEDGRPGRGVMQKRMKYQRWTPEKEYPT